MIYLYFKTQEMCGRAVENEPPSLKFVPDHFKTQEMCNEAIEKVPWLLYNVSVHLVRCVKELLKNVYTP